MINTHTESEGAYPLFASKPLFKLLHHDIRPNVRRSDRRSEPLDVVTGTSMPRDVAQIEIICDTEVGKRYQSVLVDSVPESQLSSDSIAEPVEHWQAVAAFRSCG